MNFTQILNKLESYSLSIPYVKSTNTGDIYEFLNGNPDIKYSAVNIDINQVVRNTNTMSYSIYLYYIDRLTQDKKNWKEIKTTAEETLNSIVNYAGERFGDIEDGWTITYFEQQFADYTAGAWVNFTLEVPSVLGDCLIDEYITDEEQLIERLKEAIRYYMEENAELAIVLREILYKITGDEEYKPVEDSELTRLLREALFKLG